MYNSLTRVQNVFGFFTTVAFVVAAIIAASDLTAPRTPSASLKASNVQVVKGRPHYYSTKKEEYASIKFDLEADLSSLFTWNTKQVFVYVTAEWEDGSSASKGGSASKKSGAAYKNAEGKIVVGGAGVGKNQTNKAVIWDSIITAPSSDHLARYGPATLKKLRKSAGGRPVDPSRGILSLKNQRPKYQITHPSGKIAQTSDVVLKLHYNVQPWVGVLTWNQDRDIGLWKAMAKGVSRAFALPEVKKKDEAKKATT